MGIIGCILVVLSTGWAAVCHAQPDSGVGSEVFEYNSTADITKSLYGKIAGLNVYQGSGSSADNISSMQLHGHEPLVIVDGFPRSLSDLASVEIESVHVLADAASSALYGVKGANGVLVVTTKRGSAQKKGISVQYGFGLNTPFRKPEFADAYTYASAVNSALASDGLGPRYSAAELEAFRTGSSPYAYPDVDWWNEVMNGFGTTHFLKMSFNGGGRKFRHFTSIDFYRDRSMLKENVDDDRYDTTPTDTRLSLRTNIDVDLTTSTFLKAGVSAGLQEVNSTSYGGENIISLLYTVPSAAFPVKHEGGTYGGSLVYGEANPVALLKDRGHTRKMYGTLMADISLRQDLHILAEGLYMEAVASFDNKGGMRESSIKNYSHIDLNPTINSDGELFTNPVSYGADSKTLEHSQPFESLLLNAVFQGKIAYERIIRENQVSAAVTYDMQSSVHSGRNNSHKNQSVIFNAAYSYADRYILNGVVNWSGTSYLPEGRRFHVYPAVSAAWVISNEKFMKSVKWLDFLKIRGSYGLSGWDGNLNHELWRQYYGAGGKYYFGTNGILASGSAEGPIPVVDLKPELSEKATVGLDLQAFGKRLSFVLDGYTESRYNVLVDGTSSISGVLGIDVNRVCEGEYSYSGCDATLRWSDSKGDFTYGVSVTASWLKTEIINENQAYQEYDYLYTAGNSIRQCYGLEAIGFFGSQQEIDNSIPQSFSTVRPGDIKYKDQNGDNVIDSKDVVKMSGTEDPRLYYGLSMELGYRGFELLADFQGMSGVTVSLLESPLYRPLIDNGNISMTVLENETFWSQNTKDKATMPRLTTMDNANNYQPGSLWYRDGSFLKLRNLVFSYTFPRSMIRFAEMKLFLQGNNVFSLDKTGFADPEQLQAAYPSVRSFVAGIKFNF